MKPYQDITDPTVAKALTHPLRTRVLAALEDRTGARASWLPSWTSRWAW